MAGEKEIYQITDENMKQLRAVPVAYYKANPDDEINLLDLWLVLVKRKKLFYICVLCVSLLGALYALIRPSVYNFSAVLEIGNRIQGHEYIPLEDPASVLEKINQVYIPMIGIQYLKNSPDEENVPEINASLAKGTSVIKLNIKGIEERKEMYFYLIKQLVIAVSDDHKRMIDGLRQSLIASKDSLLNQINKIEQQTNLTIEERSSLKKDLLSELKLTEIQLANIRETRATTEPLQSIEPVGKSKKLIVAVFVVAGFFIALFAVFIAEFLEKARLYQVEKEQSN